MMNFLVQHDNFRIRLKKSLFTATVLLMLVFIFFLYTSNIEIDEGTADLYQWLDILAIVTGVILLIALVPTMMTYIADRRVNKTRLNYLRKSKLNSKMYLFDYFNYGFMFIFMAVCIYPLIYVLAGSFNQGADYAIGGIYLLPRIFTFENYSIVLNSEGLWSGYLVTISRTVIGTVTAILFTTIVAYAMSRDNLKFKKTIYWINLFTMFFGGGLIPYFLIIKMVGLYDSFWVYIIPALYSVYHMIIFSSFFRSISNELHEAATVDGANEFRIYWQIYLPLSKPVIATIALWLAIGHWNSYFDTMIFTHSKDLQTLQYFLLNAIQTSTLTEGMPAEMMQRISPKTIALAAIIISMIPVLFFFPFVRKNFQSGIMIGSLKG